MSPASGPSEDRIWYVAYGSNLSLTRFRCYLRGGRPPGGSRTYPGCRNPSDPVAVAPATVPGGIRFAGRSSVWGGGMAFLERDADGVAAARAYLITMGQLSDIQAQEMRRDPVADLDLSGWTAGVDHVAGPGRYETLLALGARDDVPMITLGSLAPQDLPLTAPSAGYLRMISAGLTESHGWDPDQIGSYLASRPGALGTWTAESITALVRAAG